MHCSYAYIQATVNKHTNVTQQGNILIAKTKVFLLSNSVIHVLISLLWFSPQAMTDKTANYKSRLQKAENNKKSQIKILKKTHESQLAMKAELIHNLEELIEEQETKIAELESHIKGSSPSQSLNAANTKSSSIRKLVDSINDLHTEKSRIHETWLSTQSELETVKHEHKETVNNLSDSISELESKLRKSQAEIIKLQNEGTGSVSVFVNYQN